MSKVAIHKSVTGGIVGGVVGALMMSIILMASKVMMGLPGEPQRDSF